MSDHKAEAERLLSDAMLAKTGSDIESSRQLQALVHATLEVAEQQRIANLIAFLTICEERGSTDDAYRALELSVREGLGLS